VIVPPITRADLLDVIVMAATLAALLSLYYLARKFSKRDRDGK
jgi:uncharacterized membrane protein (DUF373 family)